RGPSDLGGTLGTVGDNCEANSSVIVDDPAAITSESGAHRVGHVVGEVVRKVPDDLYARIDILRLEWSDDRHGGHPRGPDPECAVLGGSTSAISGWRRRSTGHSVARAARRTELRIGWVRRASRQARDEWRRTRRAPPR